jgi:DNA-binding IclR family transcriptional regulator
MPRRPGITHEARAKVLLELKEFQQQHPEGCTVTRLSLRLGWRKKETERTVDDLVESGMVYGDYVSPWVLTHPKGSKLVTSGDLIKVSPWGDEFLRRWDELTKLAEARDHHYSEMEY